MGRWLALGSLLVAAWVAGPSCKSDGEAKKASNPPLDASVEANAGTGGAGGDGNPGGSGGAGAVDAGGATGCGASCEDGIPCTFDECQGNDCRHTPRHAMCSTDQYCQIDTGCAAKPKCSTSGECTEYFALDPCVSSVTCDSSTGRCAFEIVDADHDGHTPVACGGRDCDDKLAAVSPAAVDECDGLDNDCNGKVDDGPKCLGDKQCIDGRCSCPQGQSSCFGKCIDTSSDVMNCGGCDRVCDTGLTCASGVCCDPASVCSSKCVDLQRDSANCGACGVVCGTDQTCSESRCGTCDRNYCPQPPLGAACCVSADGPCGVNNGFGCVWVDSGP